MSPTETERGSNQNDILLGNDGLLAVLYHYLDWKSHFRARGVNKRWLGMSRPMTAELILLRCSSCRMVCSKTECDNLALHGEHRPGEACYLRNTLEHVGDKIKEPVFFSADIKFGAMLADYAAKKSIRASAEYQAYFSQELAKNRDYRLDRYSRASVNVLQRLGPGEYGDSFHARYEKVYPPPLSSARARAAASSSSDS